jgi:hypothetical protein
VLLGFLELGASRGLNSPPPPQVQVGEGANGRGLIATDDLQPDEVILSVPLEAALMEAADGADDPHNIAVWSELPWSVRMAVRVLRGLSGDGAVGTCALRVWKAAKADPRQQQDWFLMSLQGRRAHEIAGCAVATLCCSPPTHTHTTWRAVGRLFVVPAGALQCRFRRMPCRA